MKPIELDDFSRSVIVRPVAMADVDGLIAMQKLCFREMEPWTPEHIDSQIRHFQAGQIVVEVDGRLAASCTSLIRTYDTEMAWHDWTKVSDGGLIRNHEPDGDTLYGIEMMVHPDFRGMKLARRLYEARKDLCRQYNLERIIVGGRIPGYGAHADEMTAPEYCESVLRKALYDPVLTAQVANGFAMQSLIPDYFPTDVASRGYATFLEWRNLEYRPPGARRQLRRVENVRTAVVQYQMRRVTGFDELAQQCNFFMDAASDYKCDFVLFPELFTTQLLSCVEPTRPGLAARRLAEFTPQYLEFFSEAAIRYHVNVIAGSQFVLEDGVLYNVSFFFGRDGAIERQYKIHITPNERRWWGISPGDRVNVFDTDSGRIAILVCYDVEFPELVRIAAGKGAQILFVPFNTDSVEGYQRIRHCAQARCIENHIYVAIAGCTGNLPMVENADIHYSQSAILTPSDVGFPRDAVGAECDPNVEAVVMDDLDLAQLRRHRLSGSVQNWHDRRTDLYRVHYKEGDAEYEV